MKDIQKNPGEYFKNLYIDTSGSKSFASLLGALEVTDVNHILFGSDFPANQNIQSSVEVVLRSALLSDEKGKILSENFKNILPTSVAT